MLVMSHSAEANDVTFPIMPGTVRHCTKMQCKLNIISFINSGGRSDALVMFEKTKTHESALLDAPMVDKT